MAADLLPGEEAEKMPRQPWVSLIRPLGHRSSRRATFQICALPVARSHALFSFVFLCLVVRSPSLQMADLSSSCHPEHQHEDGVPIGRGYRRDLLSDDGAELCFEEVRAQVFRKRRQKRLDGEDACCPASLPPSSLPTERSSFTRAP